MSKVTCLAVKNNMDRKMDDLPKCGKALQSDVQRSGSTKGDEYKITNLSRTF